MNSNNPFIPGSQTPTNNPPMPGGAAPSQNSFEVDLSNVQSGYAVPDGFYHMRCISIEQDVSKSGNPMFIWTFTIVEGEYSGREFRLWTAITPAAMWKVAETVMALGVGQTGQVVKFSRSDVVNKDCGALIEQEEYNGNMSSRISRVVSMKEYLDAKK